MGIGSFFRYIRRPSKEKVEALQGQQNQVDRFIKLARSARSNNDLVAMSNVLDVIDQFTINNFRASIFAPQRDFSRASNRFARLLNGDAHYQRLDTVLIDVSSGGISRLSDHTNSSTKAQLASVHHGLNAIAAHQHGYRNRAKVAFEHLKQNAIQKKIAKNGSGTLSRQEIVSLKKRAMKIGVSQTDTLESAFKLSFDSAIKSFEKYCTSLSKSNNINVVLSGTLKRFMGKSPSKETTKNKVEFQKSDDQAYNDVATLNPTLASKSVDQAPTFG